MWGVFGQVDTRVGLENRQILIRDDRCGVNVNRHEGPRCKEVIVTQGKSV